MGLGLPPLSKDRHELHAPFLGSQIDAGKFQFGRAAATLTYEMEVLGPPGSVPILIDVSGRVFAHVGLDRTATALAQSNWSFEDVVLGPVFSDALDSGRHGTRFSSSPERRRSRHRPLAQALQAPALRDAGSVCAVNSHVQGYGE